MEKVLNYYDVCLRQSDLDILASETAWLNDQVIEFYFEYLQRTQGGEAGAAPPPSPSALLLLPAATTFLVLNSSPEEAAMLVLDPLQFSQKSLVLFALNDNECVDVAQGGSHWSLVSYSLHDNTFRHYDSSRGSNKDTASALYRVLKGLVPSGSKVIEQASAPQQRNGWDCGMYLLGIAEVLISRWKSEGTIISFEITEKELTPSQVTQLRRSIHSLILSLAENKE